MKKYVDGIQGNLLSAMFFMQLWSKNAYAMTVDLLTFTTLLANSADDKVITFFLFSIGDNLHEMSKPVFWGKQENISKCRMLNSSIDVDYWSHTKLND